MGLIERMRKQKAVYWEYTGTDGYGNPTFSSPVEIECRWSEHQEKFSDDSGEERISRAVVYVDREMALKSYLRLAELDSSTHDDPRDYTDAFEIKQFASIPNMRATNYLRKAWL
jgi:hypothetical protein